MDDKLVTIATFGNAVEANLAKNRLETAGIRAFLADADTVDMAWQLAGALGGIKLQIPEGDEEVARSLLEGPQEAVAARAAGAARRKQRKVIKLTAVTAAGPRMPSVAADEFDEDDDEADFGDDEDDDEAEVPEIDRVADRAFRSALFGILFFPIEFYALGLLLHILLGRDRPSPAQQWKVAVAAGVMVLVLGFWFMLMTAYNLSNR